MSATPAFAWLVVAMGMGFVLSALGAAVVLLLREPARRVRAIELTLLACLAAPWLPAMPGLPRVAWREWLAAAPDVAETEGRDTAAALPEPDVPAGVSAAPVSTERASAAPIAELGVEPKLSAVPPLVSAIDREPMPSAEPAIPAPKEHAEASAVVAATPALAVAPLEPTPTVELPAERRVDWPVVVATLYLVGVAAILLLDALGGIALLRVWKSSRCAEPSVQALLREVAGQHVGRVSLLVSARCRQPFTFAWLWPVIVLPPPLVAPGKERELRWALAHEWSHIANRHTWGWALAGLARAIYWPQPFVWLLRRQLRLEQDFIADAQAAGPSSDAPEYAAFLTTQAATAHGLSLGLGIAGGKSELARRVVMLVQGKRPVATCGWKWSLGLTTAIALFAVGAASLVPGGAAVAQDEPAATSAANEQASAVEPERRIAPFDRLTIRLEHLPRVTASQEENAPDSRNIVTVVDFEGGVLLGARYGRVPVGGLTIEEARRKIGDRIRSAAEEDVAAGLADWFSKASPTAQVEPAGSVRSLGIVNPSDWAKPADNFIAPPPASAPIIPGNLLHVEALSTTLQRQVFFEYPVLDDGTIGRFAKKGSLRIQGAVKVAGMTLAQAEEAVRKHVEQTSPDKVGYVAVQFAGWSDQLPNRGEQRAQLAQSSGASGPLNGQESADAEAPVSVPPPRSSEIEAEVDGKKSEIIEPGHVLRIDVAGLPKAVSGNTWHRWVEPDGLVALEPGYARVKVSGLTAMEAEAAVLAELRKRSEKAEVQLLPWGRLQRVFLYDVEPGQRLVPGQRLFIRTSPLLEQRAIEGSSAVDNQGRIRLGDGYGEVDVAGLSVPMAEEVIRKHLDQMLAGKGLSPGVVILPSYPYRAGDVPSGPLRIAPGQTLGIWASGTLPDQPIAGQFVVEAGGDVSLGPSYGRVKVEGLSLDEAERSIRRSLANILVDPAVTVALGGWSLADATPKREIEAVGASTLPARRDPTPNLRYAGRSFDQWREVLENDLDPATRMTAISALAKFGANGIAAEAAQAIVPFIGVRDGDEQVVYATALEALRNLGEPALPIVVSALASPDERIRKSAAYLLSEMPADPAALAALVQALDDKSPAVRVAAAGALGARRHNIVRAGQVLEQAGESDDESLRAEVAKTLMRYFPPNEARLRIAEEYLERAPNHETQAHFTRNAAQQNSEFMVPLMAMRLERSLARLPADRDDAGGRRWSNAPELLNQSLLRPLLVLTYAGPKAAPALPTLLQLAERADFWEAADSQILTALRAIGPAAAPTARPVLERLRNAPNANRRGEIDRLLQAWGEAPAETTERPKHSEAKAAVSPQYAGKPFAQWQAVLENDLDPATRIEAIVAIGEFGASGMSEEAAAALAKCLGNQASAVDADRVWVTVGRKAAVALAALGPVALPALVKALAEENAEVRRDAAHAVAKLGNAAAPAAEALVAAAKAEAEAPANQRLEVASAIASIASKPDVTLPVLQSLAREADWELRQAGLKGLATLEVPDDEAVRLIVDALGRPPGNYEGLTAATVGGPPQRRVKVLEHMLRLEQPSPEDRLNMLHAVLRCASDLGSNAAPLVPLMTEAVENSDTLPGALVTARQTYIGLLARMGAGAKTALPYLRSLPDDPSHQKAKRAIQLIEQSK